MIRKCLAVTLCALAASSAWGGSDPQEVLDALSGNTVVGTWDGRAYRQYFDARGWTLYQENGQPISRGSWRVNKQGHYCSTWPPQAGESCYIAIVDGRQLVWQGLESGQKQPPAAIEKGRHMAP